MDSILIEKIKSNFVEAFRVIKTNKVRTFLTALGIMFGVAAVITMLSIGNGAEKEILAQLELVGVNNIVITPIPDEGDEDEESESKIETTRFSKGLDLLDAKNILETITTINKVSPEIIMETYVINEGRQNNIKLIGIEPSFFETSNIEIGQGKTFAKFHLKNATPVCIVGKSIEKNLFRGESAIGKRIKVKNVWLEVIGVTKEKLINDKAKENLGIRDLNKDIYIPIQTFLVRYRDRQVQIDKPRETGNGMVFFSNGSDNGPKKRKPRGNYHQIDKLTVKVNNSNELSATAEIISKQLKRSHNDVIDFEITIPIHLLEQQQRTKQIFNIVLSIIAGISLLIGGIGIMNIMLASVLERTKEIGIIRAIGATKQDVILQFLSESVLISIGGGLFGVLLGIFSSYIVEFATGIETIISLQSVILSFFVATFIGLLFGIAPARAAANKSPIEAIRYE